MTAQQTSVAYQTEGLPGTFADLAPSYVVSRTNEEAVNEMPFAVAVKLGTDPNTQCKLLAAQADVVHGVVVHSHAYAKPTELGDTGLKTGVSVGIMRKGVIRVQCSEAIVVDTSAVRIRIDTNAGSTQKLGPGSFCKTSGTTHTIQVTSGMKWVRGCDADGIAWLEVDMAAFVKSNDS